MADIKKIKIGEETYNIRDNRVITLTDGGTTTAGTWIANTDSPTQNLTAYTDGQLFIYKVTKAGASTTTLNIDGLGAKTIYRSGTSKLSTQYGVGQYLLLAYNSTNDCFRVVNDYDANTNATHSGIGKCTTAASTAAKVVTFPNFALATNQTILIRVDTTNTATSGVTLNVNSTGAKSVKIGGAAWSTSNQLNKGDYLATYDGTYWNLTRIYLTDTTYSSKTAASGGADVSLVTTGEKYTWNNKQAAISDLATIRSNASTGATHASSAHAPVDAEKNVQSDWSVTDTSSDAFIKNKPTIPTVNNATLTLNVGGQTVSGNNAFTANDATNTTYNVPSATASAYGVVKVSSVNSSAVTVNSESTTAGRYYPVELNSDGKAIVNVPWTDTDTNTHNSHAVISGKKSDDTTDIKGSASSGDITLGDSGVTAGTYKRVTVNAKGIVVGGDNTDADTNTWRKVQLNGTDKLGTGTNTNPLNIKAGSNMTITESSGTFTFAATDTNTTYTFATGDSNGQIKVTPSGGTAQNISVKGLGSAAYTASTAYAAASHTHDYLGKTTYEWNKEFAAGSNGAISLGRYNMYDTQLTFDIDSTTTTAMSGKLVIATQNGRICEAKIFGDATNTLVPCLQIYQSAISNNRSWIEIFCNFAGWSKNKVHIYGVALNSATVEKQMTSVTITNGVVSSSNITSGDTKWTGTIVNAITSTVAAGNHTHSTYVKNTGNEDINGVKTFKNSFYIDENMEDTDIVSTLFYKDGLYIDNGTEEVGISFPTTSGTFALTSQLPSLVGANGTTGLIKNGSSVTSASGYTACPIISGVPYYKDTNTQAAYGNITTSGTLSTASMVVVTDSNKKVTTSSNITTTELEYLNGVSSNIQTQLNGKTTLTAVQNYLDNNSEEVDLATYFTKSDVSTLFDELFSFSGTTLIIKDQ